MARNAGVKIDIVERIGYFVLPLALLLLVPIWILLDISFLLSHKFANLLALILQRQLPPGVEDVLRFIHDWGVPASLVAISIFALFPSPTYGRAAARRVLGTLSFHLARVFGNFGIFLYSRRVLALRTAYAFSLVSAAAFTTTFFACRQSLQIDDLKQQLNEKSLDYVTATVLHFRNQSQFDAVSTARENLGRLTSGPWSDSSDHPSACLFAMLTEIDNASPEGWDRVRQEVANLDVIVPQNLADHCLTLGTYIDQTRTSGDFFRTATATIIITAAKANEQLALEGTDPDRTTKAAKLFDLAGSLFTPEAMPDKIKKVVDNGRANYFSSCFARWPLLHCDKEIESLRCDSESDCYSKSVALYSGLGQPITEWRIRQSNNTLDLNLKGLIHFSGKNIPSFLTQGLRLSSPKSFGSPMKWLQFSTLRFDKECTGIQAAPEVYVTLSQLYGVSMLYLPQNAAPDVRFGLANRAIDNLVTANRLLALDRDYFLQDPCWRGWCPVFLSAFNSPGNLNEAQLYTRLSGLASSLLEENPDLWLKQVQADCRQCVKGWPENAAPQ